MNVDLKANIINQIANSTVIFTYDEEVSYVAVITKGRVEMKSEGTRIILGPGNMIGITDVYMGRYIATYTACSDAAIFVFEAGSREALKNILAINKDYNGIMVSSLTRLIAELYGVRKTLKICAENLFNGIKNNYAKYTEICSRLGVKAEEFLAADRLSALSNERGQNEGKIEYYVESTKVPIDIQKQYFSFSTYMTLKQVSDISGLVSQMIAECEDIAEYINENCYLLCSDHEISLMEMEAELSNALVKSGGNRKELLSIVDDTIELINNIENTMEEKVGRELNIDRDKIEEIYTNILTGKLSSGGTSKTDNTDTENKLSEEENEERIRRKIKKLANSLDQILKDAKLDEKKSSDFKLAVNEFVALKDKLATDDNVRQIKRKIIQCFYDIYEAVFIKYYNGETISDASNLMLDYGFIDERLLNEKNIYELCALEDDKYKGEGSIYTVKEWLKLVYEGKKEPSKNEFDEEYPQYLKTLRKNGDILEKDEKELLVNKDKRLEFEIHNMFAYNNRIVSGQPSAFVPVLFDEKFAGSLSAQRLTKSKIEDSINRLLEIDFSAFDREAVFSAPNEGIVKEVIIKRVLPDIIILPAAGNQASMWQDISGKKRDSKGRFIFPLFMDSSIDDTMIKMFGRFRWELCRTIQGAMWNNIQYKSLTAEYSDYIQFYRKNHDLSEDRKEKLKLQIQKGRNNLREIFLIDYEAWIKYEATGAIKLNKVSREILASYCPFTKKIREKVGTQPAFAEAVARFGRENAKKIHELENRYKMLSKTVKEIPAVITDTLEYYKNM